MRKGELGMSLEFNKIAAAVLTAGVAFMGAGIIGEKLIHPKRLAEPAISLGRDQVAAAPAAAVAAAPAAPTLEPIGPLLASANAETGAGAARRACAACHSFNEGGRNGVGPNLWGIVNAAHARVDGFNYSAANRALADKPWDFEALNAFIAAPARAMPGTRMAFAGLANPQQRADIIVYLRTLSANPAPLP
jgi:cytochrome c